MLQNVHTDFKKFYGVLTDISKKRKKKKSNNNEIIENWKNNKNDWSVNKNNKNNDNINNDIKKYSSKAFERYGATKMEEVGAMNASIISTSKIQLIRPTELIRAILVSA